MVNSQYDQMEMLTYDLEEGDFTVSDASLVIPTGESVITGTFAAQVNEENFLSQVAAADNTLELADTLATHFNPYKPDVSGQLPEETTLSASCPKRVVGAVMLKRGEYLLPLIDTNAEIVAGAGLEVAATADGLDAAVGADNLAIALENIPANSGGYIRVLVEGPIAVQGP